MTIDFKKLVSDLKHDHYGGIVFLISKKEEIKKIVEYFYNKFQIENTSDIDNILSELEEVHDEGEEHPNLLTVEFKDDGFFNIMNKIQLNNSVIKFDSKIYNILDLFPLEPTYKPKKIERTLESYDNNYEMIILKVQNMDEFIEAQKILIENKFLWFGAGKRIVTSLMCNTDQYPLYIFVNNTNKKIFYESSDQVETSVYDIAVERTTEQNYRVEKSEIVPNLIDINILRKNFKNVLGLFNRKPNYSPKKVDRMLENTRYLLDIEDTYKKKDIKNIKEGFEFPTYYKYNSVVIAINDQDEVDKVREFLIDMFKNDELLLIEAKERTLRPNFYVRISKNEDGYRLSGGSMGRLKPNSEMNNYTYEKVFTYDDLKKGLFRPNYSPKKINRMLESLSNDYILNCDYFKKYNSLIIRINKDEFKSYVRFEDFVSRLEDIFDDKFHSLTNLYERSKKYDIYIRFTMITSDFGTKHIDNGYSILVDLSEVIIENHFTYKKVYTVDEIKGELDNNLRNILYNIPEYKPKKIDRNI